MAPLYLAIEWEIIALRGVPLMPPSRLSQLTTAQHELLMYNCRKDVPPEQRDINAFFEHCTMQEERVLRTVPLQFEDGDSMEWLPSVKQGMQQAGNMVHNEAMIEELFKASVDSVQAARATLPPPSQETMLLHPPSFVHGPEESFLAAQESWALINAATEPDPDLDPEASDPDLDPEQAEPEPGKKKGRCISGRARRVRELCNLLHNVKRYGSVLPVCGYNSGKYDLTVLSPYWPHLFGLTTSDVSKERQQVLRENIVHPQAFDKDGEASTDRTLSPHEVKQDLCTFKTNVIGTTGSYNKYLHCAWPQFCGHDAVH